MICNIGVVEVHHITIYLKEANKSCINNYKDIIDITERSKAVEVELYEECTNITIIDRFGGGNCSGDVCKIGTPTDGSWDDGAVNINPNDTIADGVDKINEILKELLPDPPLPLDGLSFSVAKYSGYLSQQNNLGAYSAGDFISNIIATGVFNAYTINTTKFNDADKGGLFFILNNSEVDLFDLAAHFDESERSGSQSYPPANSPNNYITILEVTIYNNFSAYQKGRAEVSVQCIAGYNNFKLEHRIDSETHATPIYEVFYDDGNRPSVDTFTFEVLEDNGTPYKMLSGLKYYYYGTVIGVSLKLLDIFNKTYVANPVELWASVLSLKQLSWNNPNSSGYSNPPNYDDEWLYSNNTLSFDKRTAGSVIVCNARGLDPIGYGVVKTFSLNRYLYNTYENQSTDKHEYFTDEYYRLPIGDYDEIPATITSSWDSGALLSNGNAQVFVNRLVYPTQDFSVGWKPAQNVDYSGFTGNQVYIRAFRDNNIAHNSGVLKLYGISWNDLNTNLQLFLKLPTQTGWLDLSKDFNAALFTGADDDGCMVSYNSSSSLLQIEWTSGTFSTANSGWMFILKVILLNSNVEITEISCWE